MIFVQNTAKPGKPLHELIIIFLLAALSLLGAQDLRAQDLQTKNLKDRNTSTTKQQDSKAKDPTETPDQPGHNGLQPFSKIKESEAPLKIQKNDNEFRSGKSAIGPVTNASVRTSPEVNEPKLNTSEINASRTSEPEPKPSAVEASGGNKSSAKPSGINASGENRIETKPSGINAPGENRIETKPSGINAPGENRTETKPSGINAPGENRTETKPSGINAPRENRTETKPSGIKASRANDFELKQVGVNAHGAGDSKVKGSAENTFAYPTCSKLMKEYFQTRYFLTFAAPIYSALALLALLQTGVVAWIRNRFEFFSSYVAQVFCNAASFYGLAFLIRLPIVFYSSFMIEHQFNLSHQSLIDWCGDEVRSFGVGSLVVLLVTGIYLLIRKFPRGWHLPVWLLVSVTLCAVVFLEPLAVDPMFNKFAPLKDCLLKSDITALCQKAGFAVPVVLVADKSKQTIKVNAYVTGYSASKRIVLFDNLIREIPEDQILAVVAHELGHYRLKHVLIGIALSIVGLYPVFLLAEIGAGKFFPLLPRRWGIKNAKDPASIAIWCLLLWTVPLFIAPVDSAISRYFESEADAYGIRLTGNPMAAARLFSTLSRVNLSDPDPPACLEFWFFSHPSIKHRIDSALASNRFNFEGNR